MPCVLSFRHCWADRAAVFEPMPHIKINFAFEPKPYIKISFTCKVPAQRAATVARVQRFSCGTTS
jgi:hypothetical protein